MKDIFSVNLYAQGLRKVRTTGVAMAIVITVLNAWVPIQNMASRIHHTTAVEVNAGEFAPIGFAVMLFAPLLVYNMFSYLNDRKGSDFFHALPQKRVCVYISFMSAVVTWIVSVLCLTTLVNTVLWSMAESYSLSLKTVLLSSVSFLILALVTAGFMALAMTLTGTAVSNCLVFFLFFLFVRACGTFYFYGFADSTPMFTPTHSWLKFFEASFFLPLGIVFRLYDGTDAGMIKNVWFFLYWAVVAIALFALSAWTYCRRRSEDATKSAPNRLMQNLYRIGVTFPFLMIGVYFIIAREEPYLFFLCVIAALLVWVIFELLTTKKIKNLLRSLPLLLIPAILAGGYAGAVYLTQRVFYASTPEREELESVRLEISSSVLSSWEYTLLTTTEITDPGVLDQVYEAIGQAKEAGSMTWNEKTNHGYIHNDTVTITLRSGRRVTYQLQSAIDLPAAFANAPQIREKWTSVMESDIERVECSKLLPETKDRIWEAFKEDFEALSEADKSAYLRLCDEVAWYQTFSLRIYANYKGQAFNENFVLDPRYTPKAHTLLLGTFGDAASVQSELIGARELLSEMTKNQTPYIYMAISEYTTWNSGVSLHSHDFDVIKKFMESLEIDAHLTDYANAKHVYHFVLQLETPVPESTDPSVEKTPTENGELRNLDMYLTFSDKDLETFRQIVADSEIMPLS